MLCAALAGAGCGGGGDDPRTPTPAPVPTEVAPAPSPPPPSQPRLALGITEPHPAFVWSEQARPGIAEPFGRWRDALTAIDPAFYRLVLEWGRLQPDPAQPANLDQPQGGCMRAVPPCLPWAGLREQLAALASRQREGGWETLVVITGTPDWAARDPYGCEEPGVEPRSRAPRADSLPAYRRLVADVLAAAAQAGATLRWWSPWNEANHPFFLSPQHEACTDLESLPAVAVYAGIARALRTALDAAPGEQDWVLGELAAITGSRPNRTDMGAFIRALPSGLVCAAPVVGQHAYMGGPDPVDTLWRALRSHDCPDAPDVWITETGAGFPPAGFSAARRAATRLRGCRQTAARLARWYRDRRVSVAMQYTLREDDLFRTGLVSTSLASAFPTLRLWQDWGGERAPGDPAPRARCSEPSP